MSLAASFLVDIPMRWEPRTNQSDGLRLLIFPQPLGEALKNQNAAPTTPPCFSRWLRSSSLLFESSRRTVNRSLLLDIPTDWEPRAKQSRSVALLAALCAAALFESSRRTKKEKPEHGCVLVFLGATGRIRTSGLPGRSRTLYPAELRSHTLTCRCNVV